MKTLAIDFDDTIFIWGGQLVPGAKEALIELSKKYRITIYSCRSNKRHGGCDPNEYSSMAKDMIQFLDSNNIPYNKIDRGDEGKVDADFYIDDRAIEFKNNWKEIVERLMGE